MNKKQSQWLYMKKRPLSPNHAQCLYNQLFESELKPHGTPIQISSGLIKPSVDSKISFLTKDC